MFDRLHDTFTVRIQFGTLVISWKPPEKTFVFKMPNDDAQNVQAQAKQRRHENRDNTIPAESLTST